MWERWCVVRSVGKVSTGSLKLDWRVVAGKAALRCEYRPDPRIGDQIVLAGCGKIDADGWDNGQRCQAEGDRAAPLMFAVVAGVRPRSSAAHYPIPSA